MINTGIYTTESALIDDVYDYLFQNNQNILINFIDDFPNSYVDPIKAQIQLIGENFQEYIIKIERVS